MTEAQNENLRVEIERLVASAQDALTDDMVVRLSATAGYSLDLLDRISRSGIDRALPAIAQLVENGDLERLVGLARLIGAVEDSLSDDIIHRLSLIVTGLASLVDKLARNEGFLRLMDLMSQDEVQECMADMLCVASKAKSELAAQPPSKGGLRAMMKIASDPATQDAMRFMVAMSKQLNKGPST